MTRKPRIAFIMPDKIKNPVGGIGVQAKCTIKHLERDFDIDIYGYPEQNDLSNYHSVFNPLPKIQHGGLAALVGQIAYTAEIGKYTKPDLVHVSDYTVFLSGIMAARMYSVPLVVSIQLSAHLMEQIGLTNAFDVRTIDGQAIQNGFKEMELLGLHEAKKIIHVSQNYKKIFSEIPNIDAKSVYIPNGIDLQGWSHHEKVSLPGNQKIKLVYVGRFSTEKNIEALLNAHIPDTIDLIFIGEEGSGNRDTFNKLIARTSEKNIHYMGPAYDQAKINILHSADAVIIPSLHECQPIIMFEALASRNVILSSFVGDMGIILNNDIAINCGTTADTVARALAILSCMDEQEMKRRTEAGFAIAQNYDWKNSADLIAKLYKEVLDSQHP